MRNAPQSAEGRVPFLTVVEEELMSRPLSFALDCHSGFGWDDSIWFPYARPAQPMPHLPEMFLLKTMFEESYPHHGYAFEPQSHQYLLHGDLWDCAYDRTRAPNIFSSMTLELGSWRWIRKNPMQLFSRLGIFNPIKAHRTRCVLRRHPSFFDFLTRARALAMTQWILLRGLTRETRHWGAFEATMRAHGIIGEDERVVFIDLLGNGDEHTRTAPFSVHALTDFVRITRAIARRHDALPRTRHVARRNGCNSVGATASR